jgi:hypothetical protein
MQQAMEATEAGMAEAEEAAEAQASPEVVNESEGEGDESEGEADESEGEERGDGCCGTPGCNLPDWHAGACSSWSLPSRRSSRPPKRPGDDDVAVRKTCRLDAMAALPMEQQAVEATEVDMEEAEEAAEAQASPEVVTEADGFKLHLSSTSASGYNGVRRHGNRYRAAVRHARKTHTVGSFATAVEAAVAVAQVRRDLGSSPTDVVKAIATVREARTA